MRKSPVAIANRPGKAEQGVLFTPKKPNGGAVLFTHGYEADSQRYHEFAKACSKIGLTGLTVDLLGHGQSEGRREDLSVVDYVQGLVSAYDRLFAQPGVDRTRIGTMAGSFGAYLTVLLSEKRPVSSMLLRVPALYPDTLRTTPRHIFDTDAVLDMRPDRDNLALSAVHNFGGRVLLVSSEKDEVIRPDTIDAYEWALNNGEHVQMPGASHVLEEPDIATFKDVPLLNWALDI